MPCGQYCYQRKWQCEGGRLRQLTNVQKQPGPTRNYGSEGARENSIRRRVMSVKTNGSKTNYGPLFGGKKKPSVFSNCGFCGDRSVAEGKNVYYNNGGTSSTNTYWNKIAVGPKGTSGSGLGCGCCQTTGGTQTITLSDTAVFPFIIPDLAALGFVPGATIVQPWNGHLQPGPRSAIITQVDFISDYERDIHVRYDDCYQGLHLVNADNTLHGAGHPTAPAQLCVGGNCVFPGAGSTPSNHGIITAGPVVGLVTDPKARSLEDCKNRLCGGTNANTPILLGGAPCSIGGKNWLNYRRFHPRGAKS